MQIYNHLEFIRLKFSKLIKNEVIIKLINENQVIVYDPSSCLEQRDITELKLQTLDVIDNCEFGKFYNQNTNYL